jgi:hypothetical protein
MLPDVNYNLTRCLLLSQLGNLSSFLGRTCPNATTGTNFHTMRTHHNVRGINVKARVMKLRGRCFYGPLWSLDWAFGGNVGVEILGAFERCFDAIYVPILQT